MLKQVVQR